MFMGGMQLPEINSVQDHMYYALWSRREQFRIFETMITVLSQGLHYDPSIANKVQDLMNDYIDAVVPGTMARQREADAAFAARTAVALNEITELLSSSRKGKKV